VKDFGASLCSNSDCGLAKQSKRIYFPSHHTYRLCPPTKSCRFFIGK